MGCSLIRKKNTLGHRGMKGFSLVELMIAMVISLILSGGMILMFTNANSNYQQLTNTTRQLENGRYAMQVMRDDIRMAGFYGEFTRLMIPNTLPSACDLDLATLNSAWRRFPVQGAAAGDGAGVNGCLPDFRTGTNVLVVRRVSSVATETPLQTNLQNGVIYLQSRRDTAILRDFDSTETANDIFNLRKRDGVTPADVRRMMVHIYFIRDCNVCTDGGDNTPTLWRRELSGAGFTSIPIAEGIEDMRIQYGIDTNGDGSPNEYQLAPFANVGNWGNVVSVSVHLLARSTEPTPGHTDNQSYTLGWDITVGPFNDAFKRQVFSTIARVENLSSRRESQ